MNKMSAIKVDKLIDSYSKKPEALVSLLQEIQVECGYLPEQALRQVAKKLDLPMIQVFGAATFYRALSLKPKGRHTVYVCLGTACHVRGGQRILEELERQLGIEAGQTTKDSMFSLETVNCLGACALGPVVVVDESYYGQMTTARVKSLLKKVKKNEKVRKS